VLQLVYLLLLVLSFLLLPHPLRRLFLHPLHLIGFDLHLVQRRNPSHLLLLVLIVVVILFSCATGVVTNLILLLVTHLTVLGILFGIVVDVTFRRINTCCHRTLLRTILPPSSLHALIHPSSHSLSLLFIFPSFSHFHS